MKNSFVMYTDWKLMIEAMDNESRGELLLAIMQYQSGEDIIIDNPQAQIAFAAMKPQFDKDKEKYDESLRKRSEAGKVAAQARKAKSNRNESLPIVTNEQQSLHDNVNVNDNDIKESTLKGTKEKQEQAFEDFWKIYPKKKSKGQAKKAWEKLNPSSKIIRAIMDKVPLLADSEDWKKDNGQYIPYPATWLNAAGWEDEIGKVSPKTKFDNFENHSYDIDDLTRKLVQM